MVTLLVVLLLAILAGFLADFVLARMGVPDPAKIIISVIVGVVVFVVLRGANLGL